MRSQLSRDTESVSAPQSVEPSAPESRSNVPGFGAGGGGGRPNLMEAAQSAVTQSTSGAGTPLPTSVRAPMEKSFGADFSGVRMHEGPSADAMGGARAATRGSHITFAPGQFDPGSRGGRELIGHELAHVTQQQQGRVQPMAQGKGGHLSTDPGLEAEADRAGSRAAAGLPAGVRSPVTRPGVMDGPTQFDLGDKLKNAWKDSNLNPSKHKKKRERNKNRNQVEIDKLKTDGTARVIATDAMVGVNNKLKGVISGELDKHFGDSMDQAGLDKLKQDLDVQGNRKKLDVLPHAKEILQKSGVRGKVVAKKAQEMATAEVNNLDPTVLNKAQDELDHFEAESMKDTGEAVESCKAKVESTVKKFVKSEYKKIVARIVEEIETDAKSQASAYKAELGNLTTSHGDLKTERNKELQARQNKDANVLLAVNEAWTHAKGELDKKLIAFLEDKLGVGGVGITRSEKLKEFRQKILEHGRDKAKAGAKTQMDAKLGGTQDDEARKDAELRAIDKADPATDKGLQELAKEGRDHAMNASDAQNKLAAVASEAAWAVIRQKTGKTGKTAALNAVKKALPDVEKDAIEKARTWKNILVKQGNQQRMTEAKTKVDEAQVAEKTGEKSGDEAFGNINPVNTLVGDFQTSPRIESGRAIFGIGMGEYLAHEIGARGAGFTRAKKVRELRKKLKLVARKKGYEDVDTELGKTGPGQKHEHRRKAQLKYMQVSGKDFAYDFSKFVLNQEMIAICRDGTKKIAREVDLQNKLVATAREAGFAGLRAGKPNGIIKKEILVAVQAKAGLELEAAKTSHGEPWINALFAGEENTDIEDMPQGGGGGGAPPTTKTVKERIEKRVGDEKVGEKAVNAAIDANNLGKGMTALARLCDVAVPNRGDAAKLEVEVRIPVPTAPGVYVVVKVAGEAERGVTTRKNQDRDNSKGKKDGGGLDSRSLKVGASIGIGAGFEAVGVRADGSFNLFTRAQGMDSDKCFQMLAYGYYRAVSKISDKMADALWGGSGKSKDTSIGGHGKSSTERAELWAAMVEETAMTRKNPYYRKSLWVAKKNQSNPNPLKTTADAPEYVLPPGERINPVTNHEKKLGAKGPYINDEEAFVEIGAGLQGRAKVKGPVVEGEGSLKLEAFKRYDRAGMQRRLKKHNTKHGTNIKMGELDESGGTEQARKQQALDRRKALKGKVGVGAVGECKIGVDILGAKTEFSGKIEFSNTNGFQLEVGAGIKFDTAKDGAQTMIEKWGSGFSSAAASVVRTLVGFAQNSKDRNDEKFAKGMGSLGDMANDAETMIDTASGGQLTTALGEAFKVSKTPSDLKLGEEVSPDQPDQLLKQAVSGETMFQVLLTIAPPHSVMFTIKEVKTRKLQLTVGSGVGVDVALEKQKRLMQFGYVRKKWHIEGLGFGTTNEKM